MSNDFYVGYYEDHYFAHHGILGQKHGVKNGPPYPLDPEDHSAREKKAGWIKSLKTRHIERKKKKQRQKALEKARVAKAEKAKQAELQKKFEADKEKVLRSGKASEILKYKGQMTNDEMEYAIQRINKEEKLYGLSAKEQQDSWQKIDKIFDKVGTITNWVNKAANAYSAVDNLLKKFNGEGGEDDKSLIDRLMKSGDLEEAYKHKDKFTSDQLKKVKEKSDLNKELDEMFGKKDEKPSGSSGDSIFDKLNKAYEHLNKTEGQESKKSDDKKNTKKEEKKTTDDWTVEWDTGDYKKYANTGYNYVNSLLRGLPDKGSSTKSNWYDEDADYVDLKDYNKKSSSSSSGNNWWSSSSSGADSFKRASDAVDDFTDELLKGNAERMSGKKKKKKK